MGNYNQLKDKIDFFLNSLDELGEVLIDQEGSIGISKGVLRIILGTLMTAKGVIIRVEKNNGKVLSAQGVPKLRHDLPISVDFINTLLPYKNSNLNKKEIGSLHKLTDSNEILDYIETLNPYIMVPLFYKKNLIGIVGLGKKFTEDRYNNIDKKILEIICNHLTDAIHNQELITSIKDKRRELRLKVLELQTLFDISLSLSSVLNIEELASEVLIRSVSTLNASCGFILKDEKSSPILTTLSSFNVEESKLEGQMFSKYAQPFKTIWADKTVIQISKNSDHPFLKKTGYSECVISPIMGKQNILGCIILGDKESRNGIIPFDENDLDILTALSSQAGVAMDNAKLFEEINEAKRYNESIMGSISTVVITINLLGEIDTINMAGTVLFNQKEESIIGEHYSFFFEKDSIICDAIATVEEKLELVSDLDIVLNTVSNDTKINFSVAPLTDKNKEHLGAVVAIEDISEQSKIKNTFKRYVSKNIVDQLLDDDQKLNLGGEEREVTVLFSDIRGFTSMSEKMTPVDVVSTLNDYFSEMIDIIFEYDGTLDKIVGDELMVVFGAPITRIDDSERAVKTALQMVKTLNAFNKRRVVENKSPINAGIGINKGKVISGNIGSKDQMDYTVIGDTVNLGARLCSYAGSQEIIISKSVAKDTDGLFNTTSLKPIMVKGKSKPITIFRVTE